MSSNPLPVAVIGCGRMGRLHARVYSQMPTVKLVGVYDADADTAASTADSFGCKAFAALDPLLERVQAATIAVPTRFHAGLAEPCLKRGIHLLIEKPLAGTVADALAIAGWAKASGSVVQVGHIERFNPAVRAMSRLRIQPRFIEVTRISPLTFRSIDVGVVLDMMIHDIDIVLSLAQSPVTKIEATGVSVIGEVEDVCNARLAFSNGCVANLTASRLALKTERRLRVFSPEGYVSLDYQKKHAIVAQRSGNLEAIRSTVAKIRSGEIDDLSQLNYAELVQIQELAIDDIEPLRAELDSFIACIRDGTPPQCGVEQGLAAVRTARQIVQAMPAQSLDR